MKRKQAIRPIRRTSPADARPLQTARTPARAYPDARTLASALRDAAARAVRVLAIPAVGLAAGCTETATSLPIAPLPVQIVEVGKVVEGLKPPVPGTEIVPMPPIPVSVTPPPPIEVVPIRPQETPPRPAGDMPAVETPPPCPLPDIDDDPPALRGRVSNVRPHPQPVAVPGGIRSTGPVSVTMPERRAPVPRTLSDEALASALASIR